MIGLHGIWWPDDVGEKWRHALNHLESIEVGLGECTTFRTAVQAGGNIGLWPRRLAQSFDRVYTFEPDAPSRACLERNVPGNVIVSAAAVGHAAGRCGISHKSLGSHKIQDGSDLDVIAIDSLNLFDVDYLQLDIEGYEYHALLGAVHTIARSHPVIQVELRGFTDHFGHSDNEVRELLAKLGYRQVKTAPGSDFIFTWHGGRA